MSKTREVPAMPKLPKLATAMTPFPYSIEVGESLATARGMMREHHIRHLPVTDSGNIVGVLSDRDLRGYEARATHGGTAISGITVGEAFSPAPYVVELTTGLDHVALTMAEQEIGSALVTKHGKLAGILTTTDICRAFGELLRSLSGDAPSDDVA